MNIFYSWQNLLPELELAETRAILRKALGPDTTEKVITMIHSVTGGVFRSVDIVTGGVFRSVDMMMPRLLELRRSNEKKLAEGRVKMQDLVGRQSPDDLMPLLRDRSQLKDDRRRRESH